MDLFPTLLEEYDLTGAPGVDEFRDHILKSIDDNMHRGHSLAVNGVSSHGGFDPLGAPASQTILKAFQENKDDEENKDNKENKDDEENKEDEENNEHEENNED